MKAAPYQYIEASKTQSIYHMKKKISTYHTYALKLYNINVLKHENVNPLMHEKHVLKHLKRKPFII